MHNVDMLCCICTTADVPTTREPSHPEPTQNGRPCSSSVVQCRYTKKILVEEGHSMNHLTHIWQLVVRHEQLFYNSRQVPLTCTGLQNTITQRCSSLVYTLVGCCTHCSTACASLPYDNLGRLPLPIGVQRFPWQDRSAPCLLLACSRAARQVSAYSRGCCSLTSVTGALAEA